MNTRNDGGPAFPRPISHDAVTGEVTLHRGDRPVFADEQEGMSLRDYFAGQALLANTLAVQTNIDTLNFVRAEVKRLGIDTSKVLAISAYELADAMLEARKR